MHGTRDRALLALDWQHAWLGVMTAASGDLRPNARVFQVDELLKDPLTPALDASLWFFESFGWTNASREQLRADQQKMLLRA